jgi:hypothetical protein
METGVQGKALRSPQSVMRPTVALASLSEAYKTGDDKCQLSLPCILHARNFMVVLQYRFAAKHWILNKQGSATAASYAHTPRASVH